LPGKAPAPYDTLQKTGEVPVIREQRKLAAIVAADVVSYSRLIDAVSVADGSGDKPVPIDNIACLSALEKI
jgi:hypothetical protein